MPPKKEIGYKKLVIYKKAKELVLMVYKITSIYPKTETFTLVPQMRRAAISVLANIVEGYSKESSAEYAHFLTISIGSLAELEVFFEISLELGFVSKSKFNSIIYLLTETKKLLYASRKTVRARLNK